MAPGVFGCRMSREAYEAVQDYFLQCPSQEKLSKTDRDFIETQSKVEDLKAAGLIHSQFHQVLTGSYGQWLVQEISRDLDMVDNQGAQEFTDAMQECNRNASKENVERVCNAFHVIIERAESPSRQARVYSSPSVNQFAGTPPVSRQLFSFGPNSIDRGFQRLVSPHQKLNNNQPEGTELRYHTPNSGESSPAPESPEWYSCEKELNPSLEAEGVMKPEDLKFIGIPGAIEEEISQGKSDPCMKMCVVAAMAVCAAGFLYRMMNPESSSDKSIL